MRLRFFLGTRISWRRRTLSSITYHRTYAPGHNLSRPVAPSFKYDKHGAALESFVRELPPKVRHAIEFRHKSWFNPQVMELLSSYKLASCWSTNQYLSTPTDITTDFIYLRMVGDRSITRFTGKQRDKSGEMATWLEALRDNEFRTKRAYVFFNNHFTGFGPSAANEFRRLAGLIELDWSNLASLGQKQRSLLEF